MTQFIIFDTEYTTWAGAQERNWGNENEYREIVHIGALKINVHDFSVAEELNILIKPKRNPQLSDYFINLTHISQQDIDQKGISFLDAYNHFVDFCGQKNLAFSYGNDEMLIAENIGLEYGTRNVFKPGPIHFVDISFYIRRIDPGATPYTSGELWKYFNLPKPHETDEHNALFDCYSILATMKHLIAQGHSLPL